MPILLAFLASTLGRWTVLAGMVVVSWVAFASHYKKVGAERVTAQIEKKVEQNAQKATEIRNSVQSTPSDRLRDKFTRD